MKGKRLSRESETIGFVTMSFHLQVRRGQKELDPDIGIGDAWTFSQMEAAITFAQHMVHKYDSKDESLCRSTVRGPPFVANVGYAREKKS